MADAPILTLQLYKTLTMWAEIDQEGAKAARRKLELHTDYLNGRSTTLALASKLVDGETKEAIARALIRTEPVTIECGNPEAPLVYADSTLEGFINEESWLIFKLGSIEPTFLTKRYSEWESDQSYKRFFQLVKSLTPINDVGERAVKFSGDFYGRISLQAEQHQGLMQNVELHRRKLPTPRKSHY